MTVREALEKLIVKSGGEGTCKDLGNGWTICLFEAERDTDAAYLLRLRYGNKQQTVGLTRDQVFTKGKSTWIRDNVWRLRPETISLFEKQIEKTIADAKARKLTA